MHTLILGYGPHKAVGVPGSLSSMITGKVSALWAASHHPKWFKEIIKR